MQCDHNASICTHPSKARRYSRGEATRYRSGTKVPGPRSSYTKATRARSNSEATRARSGSEATRARSGYEATTSEDTRAKSGSNTTSDT